MLDVRQLRTGEQRGEIASYLAKYATKTSNGFFHSLAFTSGRFPDSIQIKNRNHRVTEEACRHCHQDMVAAVEGTHREAAQMSCIRCHASSGHSEAGRR